MLAVCCFQFSTEWTKHPTQPIETLLFLFIYVLWKPQWLWASVGGKTNNFHGSKRDAHLVSRAFSWHVLFILLYVPGNAKSTHAENCCFSADNTWTVWALFGSVNKLCVSLQSQWYFKKSPDQQQHFTFLKRYNPNVMNLFDSTHN